MSGQDGTPTTTSIPSMTSPSEHVHPETGEVLATEEEWRAALAAVEERLSAYYREVVWPLRDQAARFTPADMPSHRRNRTETQEKVARCPRCGGKLTENDERPLTGRS